VLFEDRGWPALFAAVTAIAFVFPDGRLPSPRWRPIALAATASFAVLIVVSLFTTDPFSEPFERVSSPLPKLPDLARRWSLGESEDSASVLAWGDEPVVIGVDHELHAIP
jgi:hypothetical protein